MAEPVTRRTFLLTAALAMLPAHHRPNHTRGPAPTPSPTPDVGVYSDLYADTY